MVGRSEICLISGIYISEETVGVFCVFVVVNSPIGIVKISTERVLLINVAVYMAGDTCQIVACGRSVNSSQQSVSGRYRLVNRSRDVVSCKTGCEVTPYIFSATLRKTYDSSFQLVKYVYKMPSIKKSNFTIIGFSVMGINF